MATGTVQRYDTARGFGSIKPDDGGTEVFVHRSVLGASSYEGLTTGQRVDFEPESGPKGPRAKSVRSV
jgi:cold shock protein